MTMSSLTPHVTSFDTHAHVVACAFLNNTPVFALADGILFVAGREAQRVALHPDATLLRAVSDEARLVSGGDDGRVVVYGQGGVTPLDGKAAGWVDALALHPCGALAWSSGKSVTARDEKGKDKTFVAPSTVRGLAFAPKGYRLAVAHYNGVSLWFPNIEAKPEFLEWKGSHLDVAWSPDGRFVITSMQENALHGWRLKPDPGHMRMTGYPSKTRSLSWSHDGAWLATSGAEAVILWPFTSKQGPMGQKPRECGARPFRVTQVAFHPKAYVLAAGYEDGMILLIRLTDGSELLVRHPAEGSAVTALAWDATGARLGFGCADGAAGVLNLP